MSIVRNTRAAGRQRARGTDRIYPLSRGVAVFVAPFVILAFLVLYITTSNNGDHFAWHVQPPITAMIMGAGYLAGGYFFIRMALGRRWHEHAAPLPAVVIFAETLALATLLHWDRFNNDHHAFYIWVALYAFAPPLVLVVWLMNRPADPGFDASPGPRVPLHVRRLLIATGAVMIALMLWLLLFPQSASDMWPWTLSPLGARTLSGWFALGGFAAALLGRDPRWSAWRIPLEATLIWAVLTSVATLRAQDDFDWGNVASWIFALTVFSWMILIAAFIIHMELQRKQPGAAPATSAP